MNTDGDDLNSAESRMATLLLLAKGQAPSWTRLREQQNQRRTTTRHQTTNQRETAVLTKFPRRCNWVVMAYLWTISVCFKVLLFPAYKSTDFYVHRHWKAATRHLPIGQWYFDDRQNITTIHTLDYPPGFALAEYIMANNPLSHWVLGTDDTDCLALLDDSAAYNKTSPRCVAYMRSTVIIFADTMWWLGSYAVSTAVSSEVVFLLLVCHPSLLWLDHVHFQYNGVLLGVLLCSLACLLHANNETTTLKHATRTHFYHIGATVAFCLLLTLKHVYLTSSLWYIVYLLRRYCCTLEHEDDLSPLVFSWKRLGALALVSIAVLAMPCLVFVGALYSESSSSADIFWEVASAWKVQVVGRLFPFERGLVHSYWAGNVWALYLLSTKILTAVLNRICSTDSTLFVTIRQITPADTAVCILLAQLPGLRLAWQAAAEQSNAKLLQSFTMTALAAFLFQYHAHEKAILTALIPCTVWAFVGPSPAHQHGREAVAVLWDFSAVGLLSLLPLLYQPQELLLKAFTFTAYLIVVRSLAPSADGRRLKYGIGVMVAATIFQLEIAYPFQLFGRYEFLPLAVTSSVCAAGFLYVFVRLCHVCVASPTSEMQG